MTKFLKHDGPNLMRLFVPVVEHGVTEFAVTVRQIASKPLANFRSTRRQSPRTFGGILGSPEPQPVSLRRADQSLTLRKKRVAMVARVTCN